LYLAKPLGSDDAKVVLATEATLLLKKVLATANDNYERGTLKTLHLPPLHLPRLPRGGVLRPVQLLVRGRVKPTADERPGCAPTCPSQVRW
jgi:hypothetical protein